MHACMHPGVFAGESVETCFIGVSREAALLRVGTVVVGKQGSVVFWLSSVMLLLEILCD